MSDPVPDVTSGLSPEIRRRLEADAEPPDPRLGDDPFWYLDDEDDDSPSDDEDLFGFQGWTRGGTPIQEF